MNIFVPQHELKRMLEQWEPEAKMQPPAYRFAKCWNCGRSLYFGMWHLFFEEGRREAHICARCGEKYGVV